MDDETISRRDAVAGLGLMGTLLVALVGTIGVRIAKSSRDQAGPPRHSMAAVESAEGSATGVMAAAPLESNAPIAEPELGRTETVRQVTHERPSLAPPVDERYGVPSSAPTDASPTLDSDAPRFVAPDIQ